MSKTNATLARALPHIKPVIDERRANMKEFGDDWSDKPVRPFHSAFALAVAHGLRAATRTICYSGSCTKLT